MTKDLVALVADVCQEKVLEVLLEERSSALGVRPVSKDIYRHPRKDPGVFHEAAEFLRPHIGRYARALIVLDAAWTGAPTAERMRQQLVDRVRSNGWDTDTLGITIIEPELEAWVWGRSDVVPRVLRTSWESIRSVADRGRWWPSDRPKPTHPKELLQEMLRRERRPLSAAVFQSLARQVPLVGCRDRAFQDLQALLQGWFPP